MKRILPLLTIFFSLSTLPNLAWSQEQSPSEEKEQDKPSLFKERLEEAKQSNRNLFAITQHRQNYLLPFSRASNPNTITVDGLTEENIDKFEAKFQISIKTPLFLQEDDLSGVFFGFTTVSHWQVYNSEASKPFRETNYEPEIFYQWTPNFDVLGYEFNMARFGFNHHSNGQDGLKSRSWNRIFASILFSDNNSGYYFKTWWRVPEDAKADELDPRGDDNPDISDYYGRAELGFIYRWNDIKVVTQIRNNLSFDNNRSGLTLNFLYPISDRYNVLFQYFNGYGDSLIDYNRHQQRFSLGIELRIL
ncbi:phospholipase A [Glaciecola sp. 1036]|uniref:phospholipase A n=1 Tax=Alteromonadaceae TaxID=72275 RepID=UPI003D004D86